MPRFGNISIKRKLMVMIMAASVVAALLVSAGFVTYEMFTFRQCMIQRLSTLAEIIGNESTPALSFDDQGRGEENLGALKAEGHIVAAALYKSDGSLLATYPPQVTARLPATPEPGGSRFEKDALVLFQEIRLNGGLAGTIYVKSDLMEMNERMAHYTELVLVIMAAAAILSYFLSVLLQGFISQPIVNLAKTAKTVSLQKNYSIRAQRNGRDETGLLIDGFNEMLGEIQTRDAALQLAHDGLEKRVAERTQDLQLEIAKCRSAEASLQDQFARLSQLNQITKAISQRQDMDSILHVVLGRLEDHMGINLGCVALFDSTADTFKVAALRIRDLLLASRLDLHQGTVWPFAHTGLQSCQEGQTLWMHDTLKTPGVLAGKLAVVGLRSAIAVPLMVDNKLFGVLLAARLEPDSFNNGDSEFLGMLSEHVALAAHQALLHTELGSAYDDLRLKQQTILQQERLKALGQMASGIAHDVNNALSPVVGFADLILKGEYGLSANGKKYLTHILTAGQDIAHIVARLREFYRRRDDTETLNKINLNALVTQVVDMIRPLWRDIPQSKGITIELQTQLAGDIPPMVGIESEIREAMTNLVLNAVDALPNGGQITIASRLMPPGAVKNNGKYSDHVALEVTDSGVGMSEETRKRCLEPFYSTKGKHGTGLGLAMVFGIMERHEGRVEIESEMGRGTTFRLVIPVRQLTKAVEPAVENDVPVEPLQILCIDDEPLLRELLKKMLERDGHTVRVSDGGKSGLNAFRQARTEAVPFDVVITDLGMPYIDGREVSRVIKTEFLGTPIIMLTGWGAIMDAEDPLRNQVDAVLNKPPSARELRVALQRVAKIRTGVNKTDRTNGEAANLELTPMKR